MSGPITIAAPSPLIIVCPVVVEASVTDVVGNEVAEPPWIAPVVKIEVDIDTDVYAAMTVHAVRPALVTVLAPGLPTSLVAMAGLK